MPADPRDKRFVAALLKLGEAVCGPAGDGVVAFDRRSIGLPSANVAALVAAGIIDRRGDRLLPRDEARTWLRRASEPDPEAAFIAQHTRIERGSDGVHVDRDESPLGRLGRPTSEGPAFLSVHHLEAGERIRRLAERARLQPRLTMSYSPTHTAAGAGARGSEISDMAAEARRDLARVMARLPDECVGVVLDVCVWLEGLQAVEAERGWPRRSAKLVLRIGLDQAARHFGLGEMATGPDAARARVWRPDESRPRQVG